MSLESGFHKFGGTGSRSHNGQAKRPEAPTLPVLGTSVSSNPEPINITARRVWDRLCRESTRANMAWTINSVRLTPEQVDPDLTAMCRFIMTFYPEEPPLEFND